jgi:hypothetical protein
MNSTDNEAEDRKVVPPTLWEVVSEVWKQLCIPQGWRAEVVEHAIHITTAPTDAHNRTVALVQKGLFQAILREDGGVSGFEVHHRLDLRVPELGGLCLPDLAVLPGPESSRSPERFASDAALVAEVIRPGERHREARRRTYAHAPVPIYLVIDQADPEVGGIATITCLSEPEQGFYTTMTRCPVGKPVRLPEPFDFVLDTSEFPGSEEG